MTLFPRTFLKTGWLFLFAVLMAAGLLFTMVFFVCFALGLRRVRAAVMLNADVQLRPFLVTDHHVLGSGMRLH